MIAVPSGTFLKEFTLLAEQAHKDQETFIIQRPNGKNLVMMSLDTFNRLQKELYLARQTGCPKKKLDGRDKAAPANEIMLSP